MGIFHDPLTAAIFSGAIFFLLGLLVAHIEQKSRKPEPDEHETYFMKDQDLPAFLRRQAD